MSLLPYMPRLADRLLRGSRPLGGESRLEALDASVLLADVSGFTALVDRLARDHGDRGPERLQELLNTWFGLLTDIVDAAGGEVLCFPGDAALAVWSGGGTSGESLPESVHRAAHCGLEMQRTLDRFRAIDGSELRLRTVIGAGRSWAALVGGVDDRWEAVLQGEPIAQLREASDAAQLGEVVLSAAAFEHVAGAVTGERRGTHFVIVNARPPTPPHTPAARSSSERIARFFIPPPMADRFEAGQGAWLSEFRNATIAFVRICGLAADDQSKLHDVVRLIQHQVTRFEGNLNQLVADENGLTAVLAFGVIPRAHEDDAARAVRTAGAIRAQLQQQGVDARIGIGTGRVFSGIRGGRTRLEFALLGSSVVLAARLASAARDVFCDEATRAVCRRVIRFEALPPVAIKGKQERVRVWRPISVTDDAKKTRSGIVGRGAELTELEKRLTMLERRRHGGVVLLEGEPGIGKTALVGELLTRAQTLGVRSLLGAADSIERRTAYLIWRTIVTRLVGMDVLHDGTAMHERLIELLGEENGPWLAVLNPMLPAALPESEQTLSLNGESRAQTVRDLVVTLLERAAAATPLLIVLEDAHWMDSASWDVAERAVARVPRLLLLMTSRPHGHPIEPLERLAARDDAMALRLPPLEEEEIRDLLCRTLEVDEIPAALSSLVDRRAEGHPLFARELVLVLRDAGLLVVRDGVCHLRSGATDLETARLPDNVQGIVASRIDQLSTSEQLTLKVAAVLGREFTLLDLRHVHPLAEQASTIEEQCARIASARLFERSRETGSTFSFSHALVQEVAYELLPYDQRRELHQRAAEWIERASDRNIEDLSPLLAHHWQHAEVVAKAIHYLEKASERALLRDSSDREAENFLTRLLVLAEGQSHPDPGIVLHVPMIGMVSERSVKLARWERLLSQALARQGRHTQGLVHIKRSLTLLNQRIPGTSAGDRFSLIRGVVERLLRAPTAAQPLARPPLARSALLELSMGYERLVEYWYLEHGDLTPSFVATIRSVRAAEHVGPSTALSRAYSTFANLAALCRRPSIADRYAVLARTIAEQVGDRHALFRALTVGQLPAYTYGKWRQTESALRQAITLAGELRIASAGLLHELTLAHVQYNQGQLNDALETFLAVRDRARRGEALLPELWATVSLGEIMFRQGRINLAIAHAEESLDLAERNKTIDQHCRFQAHGLLASARLRQDGAQRAYEYAQRAMEAAEAGARLSFVPQAGFIGVAEVLLARCGEDREAAVALRRWLRMLRLTAFSRPILEPWDLVFRAQWNRMNGRRRLAIVQLRKAVRRADSMTLAYESGIARGVLGQALRADDAERAAVVDEACAILTRIGALGAVQEVRSAQSRAGNAVQ